MKNIYYGFLLICIISIIGCPWKITVPPDGTSEEWIAIIDIDGSNLEYLCESGAIPYFVPDLDNPGEELILIDCSSKIDLMNQDGTDRRTIIDSVGSVFNFSHNKTKMLLNHEGEIYISNVDGTEFQNLTNTPVIWESDPSFSPDTEKIVFSYTLNDIHAFIVIKDLATNQDSIVYEYNIGRYAKRVSFTHPTFQNDNQILYRLYLIDQSEEPYIYRYELHRFNIDTLLNEIIIDEMKVGNFVFNNIINKCLIKIEDITILFDLENLTIIYEFSDTSLSDVNRFSPFGNYVTVGKQIHDINNDIEYVIETEKNDFSQTETKIVGVTDRSYPEEN